MTGEHTAYYTLVNTGSTACTLSGYPAVALYDAHGNLLPFRYTRRSQYVTATAPERVVLAPGGSAYVLVAKYRCDLGVAADAATIRLTLPGQQAPVTIAVAATAAGVSTLSYCTGGPDDPGQVVSVSPVEPSAKAAGPFGRT